MAEKIMPAGVKFLHDLDGVAPYTEVADIISIHPSELEIEDSEKTHLGSSNKAREWGPGWRNAGVCDLMIYLAKAQWVALEALRGVEDAYFRIQYPQLSTESTAGSRDDWQGYISKLGKADFGISGSEKLKCPVSVRVSGLVTFTQGS